MFCYMNGNKGNFKFFFIDVIGNPFKCQSFIKLKQNIGNFNFSIFLHDRVP
jgi:hypothetical protein